MKDDEQKPMTQEERDALPPLPAEELARIQVEMALRDEVERLKRDVGEIGSAAAAEAEYANDLRAKLALLGEAGYIDWEKEPS